jgi:hypothetical protein
MPRNDNEKFITEEPKTHFESGSEVRPKGASKDADAVMQPSNPDMFADLGRHGLAHFGDLCPGIGIEFR